MIGANRKVTYFAYSYIPVIHVGNIQVNDLNKSIATEHLCTVIEFDVSMTLIPGDTWNSNPIGCCHCAEVPGFLLAQNMNMYCPVFFDGYCILVNFFSPLLFD